MRLWSHCFKKITFSRYFLCAFICPGSEQAANFFLTKKTAPLAWLCNQPTIRPFQVYWSNKNMQNEIENEDFFPSRRTCMPRNLFSVTFFVEYLTIIKAHTASMLSLLRANRVANLRRHFQEQDSWINQICMRCSPIRMFPIKLKQFLPLLMAREGSAKHLVRHSFKPLCAP